MNSEIFIPISMFACTFGIVYLFFSTRNRERMAMIEKGVDASLFVKPQQKSNDQSLKYGIVLISIAFGLLVGQYLRQYAEMPQEVAFFSMISLFSGLGLVFFYLVNKMRESKENVKENSK
jgi:hypothetical protein